MNREMVRYGRVTGTRSPKNTLVTIRQDDLVYFGIARCNRNDCFTKYLGREIATSRMDLAVTEAPTRLYVSEFGEIELHESGLRGLVSTDNIPALLDYFYNIDDLALADLDHSVTDPIARVG